MFELMNLLVGAGMVVGKALGITLYTLAEISLPTQLGQVAPVQLSSAAPVVDYLRVRPMTEEERCRYNGIVVPYAQLWEERSTVMGIETIVPPQPGTIAAYAIVVNRKDCDGREPEPMFRVATHHRKMFNRDLLLEGSPYAVLAPSSLPAVARPKWFPQVQATLVDAAKTDPVAAAFLQASGGDLAAAVAAAGAELD